MKSDEATQVLTFFNGLSKRQIEKMTCTTILKQLAKPKSPTPQDAARLCAAADMIYRCRATMLRGMLLKELQRLLTKAYPSSQILLGRSDGAETAEDIHSLDEGASHFWVAVGVAIDSTIVIAFRITASGRAEINFDRFGEHFDKDLYAFLRDNNLAIPGLSKEGRYLERTCCTVTLENSNYRRFAMRFAREIQGIYPELAALVEEYHAQRGTDKSIPKASLSQRIKRGLRRMDSSKAAIQRITQAPNGRPAKTVTKNLQLRYDHQP